MIAFLRGVVNLVGPDYVVVDIGPVGVTASCTPATALGLRIGDHVELVTAMIVREDSLTLFGFLDTDERAVFELVQTISGVGPRLALAILSTLSPDELRVAVARNDLATLTKVPGVGQKGAGRLVLELKDRIGPPTGGAPISAGSMSPAGWQGAVAAGLMSLGWSQREAESAVSAVTPLAAEMADPDIAVLLKAALQSLDRS
ncbi:MAG: Holliday junction branch migration protein RuvA [Actinobacteria bacterium]|nr:MAG: Holliday junction branch migration protein RuvA [Actinomycetota bacterium]